MLYAFSAQELSEKYQSPQINVYHHMHIFLKDWVILFNSSAQQIMMILVSDSSHSLVTKYIEIIA